MSAPQDAYPIVGLSAASVDETKSTPVPLNMTEQFGGTVTWGAGCASGQVVFEVAPTLGFTGAWENRFTSDAVDNGTESFTYPGPYSGFGRWRINTVVAGGTVSTETVRLVG